MAKLCDKLGTFFISKWDKLKEEDWKYLQEVEEICYELHSYAMMEVQVDCTKTSRTIFIRFICKEFVSSTEFKVLQINDNPSRVDKIDGMKRVSRLKKDFTENGKKCLKRLEEQVKLRFENLATDDYTPIFFDPITKNFAKKIIGENLYDSVEKAAKKFHRELYTSIQESMHVAVVNTEENEADEQEGLEMDSDEDRFDICLDEQMIQDTTHHRLENFDVEADRIFSQWCSTKIDYKSFLYENVDPHKANLKRLKGLLRDVDIFRYFREKGQMQFPSIALGARILLAKMDNSGFTERMFSAGSNAMSKKQTRMNFDLLEKRVLLYQNKNYIKGSCQRNIE